MDNSVRDPRLYGWWFMPLSDGVSPRWLCGCVVRAATLIRISSYNLIWSLSGTVAPSDLQPGSDLVCYVSKAGILFACVNDLDWRRSFGEWRRHAVAAVLGPSIFVTFFPAGCHFALEPLSFIVDLRIWRLFYILRQYSPWKRWRYEWWVRQYHPVVYNHNSEHISMFL